MVNGGQDDESVLCQPTPLCVTTGHPLAQTFSSDLVIENVIAFVRYLYEYCLFSSKT